MRSRSATVLNKLTRCWRRFVFSLGFLFPMLLGVPPLHVEALELATKVGTLVFSGEIIEAQDISGIALSNRFLVLVADEGQKIQVLEKENDNTFAAKPNRQFRLIDWPEADKELDLEGVAWGETFVYAIGSHARKRKSVKVGKKAEDNRDRLSETAIEPSRQYLFQFKIGDNGNVKANSVQYVSLRDELTNHPIFRPFEVIPSKENGIDIEGIAIGSQNQVYLGFRGPILRGGYVPIFRAELKADNDGMLEVKIRNKKDLFLINLRGRGVRDLTRLPAEGDDLKFLILAGPMGDGPLSYIVYEWDGKDGVPGNDKPHAHQHVQALCEIPATEGADGRAAKAEGIAVRKLSPSAVEFIVVYDGALKGAPTVFSCPRT